jgi:nucleoid-associated protein YgaU
MSDTQLKKATLTVLSGSDAGKVITALFNPAEYSFDRSNTYKTVALPGLGSPLVQFVNGDADQLSMELFLDDYTDPQGPTSRPAPEADPVHKRLEAISRLLNIDRAIHAPPTVRFAWGPMEFVAIIEKLGRKVTMFRPDGTPARATLTVTFKEYRTLRQQLDQPRRESADKTKRRVLVSGDSVWAMAAREYDDPSAWRMIAEHNDLDDPRDLRPGDWIEIPPLEQPGATR